ncbi:MAG TPA: hypothetical protein VMJ35_04340 [Dongiaceae bacterium]|nr:hypothetical protein [Dongiaceae bacterium]
MRKLAFVGLATISFSVVLSGAQRGGAPAVAPAPVMRAMPAPAAPAHVPVTAGSHLASPHGPTAAHVPATAHPSTAHPGSIPAHNSHTGAPALAHRVSASTVPGTLPQPPINRPVPGRFIPGDAFSNSSCFFGGNCYPVPGFGFDYEHFFAVHPNWNKFQRFTGVTIPGGWGGGFYYPVPYYEGPQENQEENAAAPAEQESNVRASTAPSEENAPVPSARVSSPYATVQPVEEYVFVKRDGTRIFAVAYSLAKDKLQYITKEGLRRTLPLDALDYDATMKSNEERGNTVTLPGAPPASMAMLR